MTAIEKIRVRLERLERQKGYIFGMAMAEYAHAARISEKEALADAFGSFDCKDCSLIKKGFKAQKNAISKRLEKEELARRNLFTLMVGG
jgi:Uri superfamily endonuclease